jgi:hypothetical protein
MPLCLSATFASGSSLAPAVAQDLRAAAPAGDLIPSRSKDGDLTTAQIIEERAAAVGVSLSAPANEDPTVVAAAVASTGIDPAFLAAL